MIKRLLTTLIAGFLLMQIGSKAQNTPMYAAYVYGDSIWEVDTTSFSISTAYSPTWSGGTISGFNGMTTHPCTGEYYVIFKSSVLTGRGLGIWRPVPDTIEFIGDLGDNFAGISFSPDARLWGVTGDGANTPETVWEVDPGTATSTLLVTNTAGSDGESIAFCKDNGKVYRWSGRDTNPAMQKIDTANGTVTTIPRTGFNYDEVFGAVYIGNGEFLLANLDQQYIIVDTSGFATLLGPGTHQYQKGLTFPINLGNLMATPADDSICPADTFMLNLVSTDLDSIMVDFGDGTVTTFAAVDSTLNHLYNTGTYTVTVTPIKGICGGIPTTISLTVLNVPNVSLNPNGDYILCPGSSVTLTGSNGGSSQWYMNGNMISGANNNTYTANMPGLYNMVKTNQNGCSDSASVGVNVMPKPILTVSAPDTICDGDTAWLSTMPDGAAAYTWYNTGVMIPSADSSSYGATTAGDYAVMVDWNGDGSCTDSLSVVTLVVNTIPSPSFTQSADTVVLGSSVSFTNGSGSGSAAWDFGDGNTSTQTDPSHTYGATGTYTVTLTQSNDCGSGSTTGTVVVIDTASALTPGIAGFQFGGVVPNPFQAETRVQFHLQSALDMELSIHNLLGERIATLHSGRLEAGAQALVWNGRNDAGYPAAAGMYILRIRTAEGLHTVRLSLTR